MFSESLQHKLDNAERTPDGKGVLVAVVDLTADEFAELIISEVKELQRGREGKRNAANKTVAESVG